MPLLTDVTRALARPFRPRMANSVHTGSTPALRQTELRPRLVIPTCDRSREEKEQGWHHAQGLHLARQERWDDLSFLIRQFDGLRAGTPGGTPIATLLAQGARADTVMPVLPSGAPLTEARRLGVAALDALAEERAGDYPTTLVAVLAHLDLGWTFRGAGWTSELRTADHQSFIAHFDRAATLLSRFDPVAENAPALAAAACAALPGAERETRDVVAAYEALIALDPTAPAHLRAFGNHLLPRWFGSYDRLNLEARRAASATSTVWGNGGYTWMMMDALLVDERAWEQLDTDFFLDGVRDILTRRPEQHLANLFAAYLGLSTRPAAPRSGDARRIEKARARASTGFRWVLHEHLRELHPLLWADAADRLAATAAPLHDRAALIRRGRAAAFSRIAEAFAHVIAEGQIVRFDPEGVVYSPAT